MMRKQYESFHLLYDRGTNFYGDGEMREVIDRSDSQKTINYEPKKVKNKSMKGNIEPLEFRREGKILIIL